jgi:hypothetical protein
MTTKTRHPKERRRVYWFFAEQKHPPHNAYCCTFRLNTSSIGKEIDLPARFMKNSQLLSVVYLANSAVFLGDSAFENDWINLSPYFTNLMFSVNTWNDYSSPRVYFWGRWGLKAHF